MQLDTPETDSIVASEEHKIDLDYLDIEMTAWDRIVTHARKMERERNAEMGYRGEWCDKARKAESALNQMQSERDHWKAQCQRMFSLPKIIEDRNKLADALRNLRNASLQYKMDKDDLEIGDADEALARVNVVDNPDTCSLCDCVMPVGADRCGMCGCPRENQSKREAGESADEQRDRSALNAKGMARGAPESPLK